MPADPAPLIDDLTATVTQLTAKVATLTANQEKLSDDHAAKFTAALASLKLLLA